MFNKQTRRCLVLSLIAGILFSLYAVNRASAYDSYVNVACDGAITVVKESANAGNATCNGPSKTIYVLNENAPAGTAANFKISWVCDAVDSLSHILDEEKGSDGFIRLHVNCDATDKIDSMEVYSQESKSSKLYDFKGDKPKETGTLDQPNARTLPSQPSDTGGSGAGGTGSNSSGGVDNVQSCANIQTSVGTSTVKCIDPQADADCSSYAKASNASAGSGCGIVTRYINPAIKFVSGLFGVVVVIMIIIGGIQYASAGGEPQKVAAAKKRIFNAIFALICFGLLFGLLNFLIPGGL